MENNEVNNNINNEQPIQEPVQNNVKSEKPKKKSKLIFFIIPIVLVVAVVLGIVFLKKPSDGTVKTKKTVDKFDINAYIPFSKDGLYGYMDTNGKVVIEPQYESAGEFNNGLAHVSLVTEGSFLREYQVIDKKGNAKINYKIHYTPLENGNILIDSVLYTKKYKKITDDKYKIAYDSSAKLLKWETATDTNKGLMDLDGKIIYTHKFKSDYGYLYVDRSDVPENFKDNYCVIKVSDDGYKYGIINCKTGKVVYNLTEKTIYEYDNNIFKIYAEDYDYNRVYVQDDKVVYTAKLNEDLYYYGDGYLYTYDEKSNRVYINTKTGKEQSEKPEIKLDVDLKNELSDWELATGFEKIESNRGYGLLYGNKVAVPCEWDKIYPFPESVQNYLTTTGKGYVVAKRSSEYYLVSTKNGKTITKFDATDVETGKNSVFVSYKDKDKKVYSVYSMISGKSLSSDKEIAVGPNYVIVTADGKKNYYNSNLKLIYTGEINK